MSCFCEVEADHIKEQPHIVPSPGPPRMVVGSSRAALVLKSAGNLNVRPLETCEQHFGPKLNDSA